MEIRSLAHTSFEALAEAFGAAFATYEVQISPDELRTMLRRRGFDPGLSFAAFDESGRIAGFTLNGIGTFSSVPTAYDTGTGTLPGYRGRGLATQIFEASLPHLRAAGIEQYLLEALQHNTAAVSVYRKLGFEVSREFNYFRSAGRNADCGFCHAERRDWIRQVELLSLRETAPEFWDFTPSWQNSFEAIERAPEDFITLGAFDDYPDASGIQSGDRLVGYVIFEPAAGEITQIAVAKSHRQRGIGSALLSEVWRMNRAPGIKCINTEVGRDGAIGGFLQARNIPLAGKQFEMIKRL